MHVWGYEQTPAYLFPDLEREMRRVDFQNQQGPDGGINNRTEIPSPPGKPTGERPFTDGHASCVLKFYREARNHADGSAYLRAHCPCIHAAAVDYLIVLSGWDYDRIYRTLRLAPRAPSSSPRVCFSGSVGEGMLEMGRGTGAGVTLTAGQSLTVTV